MARSAPPPPPGRVALTVAGGEPLGAFEGGAVAALVAGLQPLCAGEHPRVRVDVITGASSGAITGLLAAHCLTTGADPAATLHEAWVERASLDGLQGREWRAPLSLDRLRRAAIELLTTPGNRNRRQRAPVHVEVALASLRGDPVGPGALTARHLAWSGFDVTAEMAPRQRITAIECALASAANPVAFAPPLVAPAGEDESPSFYADGGWAAGGPISRARQLAADTDAAGRLVVLVHALAPLPAGLGPAWSDPQVPPTWAATVRRGLQVRRRELVAADLALAEAGAGTEIAVIGPDRDLGSTALGGLAGLASRDRRRRDFELGFRCGLRLLDTAVPGERLGLDDRAVSEARSAAAAAYETLRRQGPTSPPARRREAAAVVRVGARTAAVAVHDALLAHRRAQDGGAPAVPLTAGAATRLIHRQGAVFEATLRVETVVPAVREAFGDGEADRPALVRLSRFWPTGAGARFVGIAVQLTDTSRGEQDLLLVSAGRSALGRRVFRPTDTPLLDAFYTSALTAVVAGERLVVGATPEEGTRPDPLDALLAADDLDATLRLEVARPLSPWFSLGLLTIGRRRPDLDVRFHPTTAWPRLDAGPFGRLRDLAYRASQQGRWPTVRRWLHADDLPPGGVAR
jgi:predicted acylesterase/phospholipase RssA